MANNFKILWVSVSFLALVGSLTAFAGNPELTRLYSQVFSNKIDENPATTLKNLEEMIGIYPKNEQSLPITLEQLKSLVYDPFSYCKRNSGLYRSEFGAEISSSANIQAYLNHYRQEQMFKCAQKFRKDLVGQSSLIPRHSLGNITLFRYTVSYDADVDEVESHEHAFYQDFIRTDEQISYGLYQLIDAQAFDGKFKRAIKNDEEKFNAMLDEIIKSPCMAARLTLLPIVEDIVAFYKPTDMPIVAPKFDELEFNLIGASMACKQYLDNFARYNHLAFEKFIQHQSFGERMFQKMSCFGCSS